MLFVRKREAELEYYLCDPFGGSGDSLWAY